MADQNSIGKDTTTYRIQVFQGVSETLAKFLWDKGVYNYSAHLSY